VSARIGDSHLWWPRATAGCGPEWPMGLRYRNISPPRCLSIKSRCARRRATPADGIQQVVEVNFGGGSGDPYCDNARAAMWKGCKEWLPKGAIDANDHRLAIELASPGFHLNQRNRLVIESKQSMTARGVASPDRADALCLTSAMPVARNPKLHLLPRDAVMPTSTSWLSA
jgi:hypothetical protein